jgi:hypothetical protein
MPRIADTRAYPVFISQHPSRCRLILNAIEGCGETLKPGYRDTMLRLRVTPRGYNRRTRRLSALKSRIAPDRRFLVGWVKRLPASAAYAPSSPIEPGAAAVPRWTKWVTDNARVGPATASNSAGDRRWTWFFLAQPLRIRFRKVKSSSFSHQLITFARCFF